MCLSPALLSGLRALFTPRLQLVAENLALRQQPAILNRVAMLPRRPWQNPFVERLIGSIHQECLDHVILLGENHLRRILNSCFAY
jgi:hypothetical protein